MSNFLFSKPIWVKRMFCISQEQSIFLNTQIEGRKSVSAVVRQALDDLIFKHSEITKGNEPRTNDLVSIKTFLLREQIEAIQKRNLDVDFAIQCALDWYLQLGAHEPVGSHD
ncbi:MAG: hypothetical protein ACREBY_20700 [Polaromonas sp.]